MLGCFDRIVWLGVLWKVDLQIVHCCLRYLLYCLFLRVLNLPKYHRLGGSQDQIALE